mgnify:CR=1 FL=1
MTTIFGNTVTEPKVAFSFEKDQLTLYIAPEHVSLPDDSIIGVAINTSKKYYFKLLGDTCKYISSIPIITNISLLRRFIMWKTIWMVRCMRRSSYHSLRWTFFLRMFFLRRTIPQFQKRISAISGLITVHSEIAHSH